MGLPPNLVTGKTAVLPTDWKKQSPGHVPAGSGYEEGFLRLWRSMFPNLPEPWHNYRFHATRKWTIDFAWPAEKLAIEIEGGAPGGGRHQRREGFTRDAEKYRAVVNGGWHLLRWTTDELRERPIQIVEEVAKILMKRR
jgi:very-short-patch-repair endonuclease